MFPFTFIVPLTVQTLWLPDLEIYSANSGTLFSRIGIYFKRDFCNADKQTSHLKITHVTILGTITVRKVFQSELVTFQSISDRDLSGKLCCSVIQSRSEFNDYKFSIRKYCRLLNDNKIKKYYKVQRASRGWVTKAPYLYLVPISSVRDQIRKLVCRHPPLLCLLVIRSSPGHMETRKVIRTKEGLPASYLGILNVDRMWHTLLIILVTTIVFWRHISCGSCDFWSFFLKS